LTWNSLRMRSRRRPRRVYRDFAHVCRVAEVLEVRSLLSGNVVATLRGPPSPKKKRPVPQTRARGLS
jgi:hypothetical protein